MTTKQMRDDLNEFGKAIDDVMPYAWAVFSVMMLIGCAWFEMAMRALG